MSDYSNATRALSAGGIKKTALATSLSLLVGGLAAPSAIAALPTGATLNFTLGVPQTIGCLYGTTPPCTLKAYNVTDIIGSYFVMDQNGNGPEAFEKTPIESFNGLIIGTTQLAANSHTGPINGTELPDIDNPWTFFSNTGMHQTTSNTTVASEVGNTITLNLPWSVNWNANTDIPMSETSVPTMTCDTASCTDGSNYTLDGAYHVGGAGFTSVAYFLHLEGSVSLPGNPPVTAPDSANTIVGNEVRIPVLINDSSADGFDATTPITVSSAPSDGSTNITVDGTTPQNSTLDYTPNTGPDFTGMDTLQYTAKSGAGADSTATDVTVDVQANVAPLAVDDPIATNQRALDQSGGSLTIDVLANDTDANNDPGLPGGIDVATVSVTNTPGNVGTCTANVDGSITYSQTLPSVAATDSCTYTVTDIDTFAAPLASTAATVPIDVQSFDSDWPPVLPPDIIPILAIEPGIGDPDQSIQPDKSWFSMQVSATQLIYTPVEPGPDGGFIIGFDQPATGSHTGKPDGSEQPGYSAPWLFFSNTGFDLTRNGGIEGNADGTLDFRTKYVVTWNGIPVINLGGSSQFPEDTGFANIACSDKPCQHNSTFVLDYDAHVEDVAGMLPSGFNGVPYGLHLEGTVNFLDGNLKVSNGTVTTETRLSASEVVFDDEIDLQCVSSCFDYTVEDITEPSVELVLPQAGGVRNFPVWRILDNGVWRDFDTRDGDSVKSAPAVAGADTLQCPEPGDSAYIDLSNDTTVNVGHQCIQLSMQDNGLNDLNPAVGTISDPGGLGTTGPAVPVYLSVSIDIKPGNKHNVINPRGKGGILVAVLSHTDPDSPFDPSSQVDIPTVEFGPAAAKAIRHRVRDINSDGLGDLLLQFKVSETGIACGDTQAALSGKTFDDVSFSDTDTIRTVGCKPVRR